ncbi:MAG TPA: DUF3800 domain-containing protein, partial [Thermoanaerobaculia bacterium]|nr:DUF3800 domain-containing protein [Thermoanaerobaculia bacterium]
SMGGVMAKKYVFADESGNYDFSLKQSASKYFVVVTVTVDDCTVGARLLDLRREMAAEGLRLDSDQFHATSDAQVIRDRVYPVIASADLRIDAIVLEKRKAFARIRSSEQLFYQTAWYQHMKYVGPRIACAGDELLVVGASVGTGAKRRSFHNAVTNVLKQVTPTATVQVACWASVSEPCLQVADYCAWAIQRKWEAGDLRSYDLIKAKIKTEFDLFAVGKTYHY